MTRPAGGGGDRPGDERPPGGLPSAPECPFCRGEETELMNAFGAHASVSTYWCRACRCPFEVLRWRSRTEPGTTRP